MRRKANRGESLIETMFALLVGSISVMLLATMISASAKLIRLGEDSADAYTENLNGMNYSAEGGAVEGDAATLAIQFDDNGDGKIDASDMGVADAVPVKVKSFRDGGSDPVFAYERDPEGG